MGYTNMPPAGVVITGGISYGMGLLNWRRTLFNVRCACPAGISGVKSPIYSTAVGIIHYVNRNQAYGRIIKSPEKKEGFFMTCGSASGLLLPIYGNNNFGNIPLTRREV